VDSQPNLEPKEVKAAMPSPKKKRKKQKDRLGAPNNIEEPDALASVKKSRPMPQLSLQKCMYMEESDVKKLNTLQE